MSRLRDSQITFSHKLLDEVPLTFKLAFLNARSLNKHLLDVKCDSSVQSASVVCFCETRFDHRDPMSDTKLDNFEQFRQDYKQMANTQRPPYGLAIYSHSKFLYGPSEETEFSIECVVFEVEEQPGVLMVFLYKSPKISSAVLLRLLQRVHKKYQHNKAVIFGDFNIDWNVPSKDKNSLHTPMTKLGYRQVIEKPSIDFGSTIDLIFTNIPTYQCGVVEAYYTDHKLCWIAF